MKIPNRPSERDDFIIREAAIMLSTEVADWCREGGDEVEEEGLVDIQNDLFNAMKWAGNADGYDLARRLEDASYMSDSQLVEILDASGTHLNTALNKAIQEWIKAYQVSPKLKIGDKCRAMIRGMEEDGEIVNIYHDSASYSVFIERLGHVKTGVGTNGIIIPWERLDPQPESQETAPTVVVEHSEA